MLSNKEHCVCAFLAILGCYGIGEAEWEEKGRIISKAR